MDTKKIILTPKGCYLFLSLASIITAVFALCYTKGEAWAELLPEHPGNYFMDFFNHIYYMEQREICYEITMHVCFPAFAYLFYLFLNRLIPIEAEWNAFGIRESQCGLMVFAMYMVLITAVFCIVTMKFMGGEKKRAGTVLITLLCSASFIYLFERGNIVYLVIVLLLLFLYWKESEKPWKREAAILCLAAAAGFKIYPAIFGLLYLKERRYAEAGRAVLYGILVFFVPFIWFGGWQGFLQFLQNLNDVSYYVWEEGGLNSITHFMILLGNHTGLSLDSSIAAGQAASAVFLILSLLSALWNKSRWKTVAVLCGIMILFPMWSGYYTITYMCIPLLCFLNETEIKYCRKDMLYAACYACIFSLLVFESSFSLEVFASALNVTVRYFALFLLLLFIAAEEAWCGIQFGIKKVRGC